MSVIEAMLTGLPVVATNVRGPAEQVIDGETGLSVPPAMPPRWVRRWAGWSAIPTCAPAWGRPAGSARWTATTRPKCCRARWTCSVL